jgi:hypothetical protein
MATRSNVNELHTESEGTILKPETTVTVAPDSMNAMKVSISRTFKINMGNYESMDSFVSVTLDVTEGSDLEELATKFGETLDTLQAPDLELAHHLTKERNSLVKILIEK